MGALILFIQNRNNYHHLNSFHYSLTYKRFGEVWCAPGIEVSLIFPISHLEEGVSSVVKHGSETCENVSPSNYYIGYNTVTMQCTGMDDYQFHYSRSGLDLAMPIVPILFYPWVVYRRSIGRLDWRSGMEWVFDPNGWWIELTQLLTGIPATIAQG